MNTSLRPLRLSACVFLASLFCTVPALADSPPSWLLSWGSYGSSAGQFRGVAGIAIDENDFVYVSETINNRVQKFDADGNYVDSWGTSGASHGNFYQPHGICADGNGRILVADSGNHRVEIFTTNGVYLQTLGVTGVQGSGDGEFSAPRGVATDPGGNIYVCDTFNNRVQKFSSAGTFLLKWGSTGSGPGQFSSPRSISVDGSGLVFVGDGNNKRVQVFDGTGAFQYQFGNAGSGAGQFGFINGLTAAAAGVYVSDTDNHRVEAFSADGSFLTEWGTAGAEPNQFDDNRGVAVSSFGDVFVVDSGNSRVQRFTGGAAPALNTLRVGDGRGLPVLGAVTVPVSLDNNQTASGLEVVIDDVPDWFHVTDVAVKGRASGMEVSWVDGTGLHLIVYSSTGAVIGYGTGEILDVSGTIDPSAVVGDSAALAVTSVLMADATGDSAGIDAVNGVLHIERVAGDVNGDNLLDAGDLVRLIEIILGTGDPPTPEELGVADCNDDTNINLFDVTCLVDLILGSSARPAPPLAPRAADLEPLVVNARENVKAIQFSLPAGTPVEAASGMAPFLLHRGTNARGETVVIAFDSRGKSWTAGSRSPFLVGQPPHDFRAFGDGGRRLPVTAGAHGISIGAPLPPGLVILGTHPNPFRGRTAVRFSVDRPGPVRFSVFDVHGALVSRSEERRLDAGEHFWIWNAVSDNGSRVSAGVYIAVVEAEGRRAPVRMVLVGP